MKKSDLKKSKTKQKKEVLQVDRGGGGVTVWSQIALIVTKLVR